LQFDQTTGIVKEEPAKPAEVRRPKLKPGQKKALQELRSIPRDIMQNPRSRKDRRHIEQLMKRAGFHQDAIAAQRKQWNANREKATIDQNEVAWENDTSTPEEMN